MRFKTTSAILDTGERPWTVLLFQTPWSPDSSHAKDEHQLRLELIGGEEIVVVFRGPLEDCQWHLNGLFKQVHYYDFTPSMQKPLG